MKRLLFIAAAAVALGLGSPSTAATLVIDENGILTGATGVDVLGVSYDVEFLDGTFAEVFGDGSGLAFSGSEPQGAVAAAQSLLDQVFLGIYDDNPNLVRGCSFANYCNVYVPYEVRDTFLVAGAARNFSSSVGLADATFVGGSSLDQDTSRNAIQTSARFSLSNVVPPPVSGAVPEPATWAMMLFGFFGVGGTLRSTRGRQRLSVPILEATRGTASAKAGAVFTPH